MSADLAADLARDEELRLTVYDDATGKPLRAGDTLKGNPTIGFGRCLSSLGITEDEARTLLANDLSRIRFELDTTLPWWRGLSEGRQRALANMAFNLGIRRLLGFQAMLAALKAGNYRIAAAEALDSAWAREVGERARRIAALLENG